MMGAMRLHVGRGLVLALTAGALVGCSSGPGALARAESTGILTVGVVESPPATVPEEGGEVSGPEADAIRDYATSIGAHPTWQVGTLDALVAAADRGEVDVVIGATDAPAGTTPTAAHAGHVMLVDADELELRDSLDAWLADNR